jgi:hypothetical protein
MSFTKKLITASLFTIDFFVFVFFLLSVDKSFKYLQLGLFFILFLLFLLSKKNKYFYGLLCYGIGYFQIIWAETWGAALIRNEFNPLVKSIHALIIMYLLWNRNEEKE